jgi:hypothetical protein
MGMRRSLYFVAAILLMAKSCLAYTGPNPRNFGLNAGAIKLNQYWRLTFEQNYIADEQGEDIRFTQSDMGLVCNPVVDWLELGINYKRIYQRTDADPYKAVNRPHMNVTFRGQILALDVSSASRFEYQSRETQKDFWRCRNKFAVKFPSLFTAVKLQPYVSHDFFTDLTSTSDYTGSGFSSGASLRLSRNLSGDFYYRWQTSRYDGVRYDYTIIGTALRFTF